MIGVQKYMLGLCAPIATGEIDVIKRCCVGAPSFQVKVGVVNAASGGKAFGRWVTQLSIKIKVVKIDQLDAAGASSGLAQSVRRVCTEFSTGSVKSGRTLHTRLLGSRQNFLNGLTITLA